MEDFDDRDDTFSSNGSSCRTSLNGIEAKEAENGLHVTSSLLPDHATPHYSTSKTPRPGGHGHHKPRKHKTKKKKNHKGKQSKKVDPALMNT